MEYFMHICMRATSFVKCELISHYIVAYFFETKIAIDLRGYCAFTGCTIIGRIKICII